MVSMWAGLSTPKAGGQAVIEGVMMRHGQRMAVAVRTEDGEIDIDSRLVLPVAERFPVFKWPVLRGMGALVDALRLGIPALMFSANAQAGSEEEELSAGEMTAALVLACILGVGLFVVLPTVVGSFFGHFIEQGIVLNLLEGLVRLVIVVGYIATISRMPDIGRVFEYHGAEHQVINAWEEKGSPLKQRPPVEMREARQQSTTHFRCGTSFILMVAFVSVLLYTLFGWPSIWVRMGVRFLMLPVVGGIAYELMNLGAENPHIILRGLLLPGLWIQRLTTRSPDDGQIEVAVAALDRCLHGEEENGL